MVSEIAKRRKIDRILSPPIEEVNRLATELRARSNAIKSKLLETEAFLKARKAKLTKEALVKRNQNKLRRPKI